MKTMTKLEKCIYAFLECGQEGMRSLEAASQFKGIEFKHQSGRFWSSCLNTDVSILGDHGIAIDRCNDPYINADGKKSHFKRYWLKDRAAAERALNLLNHCRRKRGAKPLPDDLAKTLVGQFPEAEPTPKAG